MAQKYQNKWCMYVYIYNYIYIYICNSESWMMQICRCRGHTMPLETYNPNTESLSAHFEFLIDCDPPCVGRGLAPSLATW